MSQQSVLQPTLIVLPFHRSSQIKVNCVGRPVAKQFVSYGGDGEKQKAGIRRAGRILNDKLAGARARGVRCSNDGLQRAVEFHDENIAIYEDNPLSSAAEPQVDVVKGI